MAYSTRWNETNAYGQCRGCNMRHEYDAEKLRKKAVAKHGEKVIESLYRRYSTPLKLRTDQILEIARYYLVKADAMKEKRGGA